MKKILFYCTLVFSSIVALAILVFAYTITSGDLGVSLFFGAIFLLLLLLGVILSIIDIHKNKL